MKPKEQVTQNEKDEVIAAIKLLVPAGGVGASLGEIFRLMHPGRKATAENGHGNSREYARLETITRHMANSKELLLAKGPAREKGHCGSRVVRLFSLPATGCRAEGVDFHEGGEVRPQLPLRFAEVQKPETPASLPRPPKQTRQFECEVCPNHYISAPASDDDYEMNCSKCHSIYLIKGNFAFRLREAIPIELWQKVKNIS